MGAVSNRDEFRAMLARARNPPPHSPAARAEIDVWRAARHAEAIAHTPLCPECGRNIVEAGHGQHNAAYCSNACKQRAYRKRKKSVTTNA